MSLRLEGEETLKHRCVCCPRSEKFNTVSNDHGRTQKSDFCVSVGKTNFTDHHTPDTISCFRDSVLVCKCTTATVRYAKQFRVFSFLLIRQSSYLFIKRQAIAIVKLYENKPLQNAFKACVRYFYQIFNLSNFCCFI